MAENPITAGGTPPRRPLSRVERRVFGVLVEKAKTTPENYPLSLASLVAGSNQKSNRDPQMQLAEEDVQDALQTLRDCGAVREVQGSGRVSKYRHCAYEWLQVDAPQAALMTELLLRGPQTAGQLRANASRMEPFESLESLLEVLSQLERQGMVRPLTPPGRGQQFAHTLYLPGEIDKLQQRAAEAGDPSAANHPMQGDAGANRTVDSGVNDAAILEMKSRLDQLSLRVSRLEQELGLDR